MGVKQHNADGQSASANANTCVSVVRSQLNKRLKPETKRKSSD